MQNEYSGEERRNCTLNERQVNDLLATVAQTKDMLVSMDKMLAVNIQRQEMFYQRIDHLEKHYEKLDERQQVYEDRLQCIINKMNGIKWAFAIIVGIGTLLNWGADLFIFIANIVR